MLRDVSVPVGHVKILCRIIFTEATASVASMLVTPLAIHVL